MFLLHFGSLIASCCPWDRLGRLLNLVALLRCWIFFGFPISGKIHSTTSSAESSPVLTLTLVSKLLISISCWQWLLHIGLAEFCQHLLVKKKNKILVVFVFFVQIPDWTREFEWSCSKPFCFIVNRFACSKGIDGQTPDLFQYLFEEFAVVVSSTSFNNEFDFFKYFGYSPCCNSKSISIFEPLLDRLICIHFCILKLLDKHLIDCAWLGPLASVVLQGFFVNFWVFVLSSLLEESSRPSRISLGKAYSVDLTLPVCAVWRWMSSMTCASVRP